MAISYTEQMRLAAENAARAATTASNATAGYERSNARQQRTADQNFSSAATAASNATAGTYGGAGTPSAAPQTNPWSVQGGLPDLTAPSQTEKTAATAPEYAPKWGEGAYENLQGALGDLGNADRVNDALDRMMAQDPTNTNYREQEYQQFNRPEIAEDPGFGAYYENAKNRLAESINQQMAARGSYGSSVAGELVSRGMTDLEAERANREADYNLQRLQEQRAWEGLGGELAAGADTGGLENLRTETDINKALVDAAATGDQTKLDAIRTHLETAMGLDEATANWWVKQVTGASAADAQRYARGELALEGTMGMGEAIAGIMGEDYEAGFDSDWERFMAENEMTLGPLFAQITANDKDSAEAQNALSQIIDLFTEASAKE